MVFDLVALVRERLRQVGRPPTVGEVIDADDAVRDERISVLEQREREIQARLRLLEIAGDPRGIRDES